MGRLESAGVRLPANRRLKTDNEAEVARQGVEAVTEPTYRDDFATWLSSSGSSNWRKPRG